MTFIERIRLFIRSRRGVTAIEYGILAAGVAIVIGALVSSDGPRSAISSKASLTICRRKVANSTVLAAAAMAVLVWASWSDLTKREIPNAAAVLLGLTAVVDAWIGGSPLQAGWLGCISILIVGFPVSAYLGLIGAGDIKLLAAAALWTSARTLDLLLITAWAGGVLALLYLCLNLVRTRRTTEIPYGVAVSLSLLLMLTHMV